MKQQNLKIWAAHFAKVSRAQMHLYWRDLLKVVWNRNSGTTLFIIVKPTVYVFILTNAVFDLLILPTFKNKVAMNYKLPIVKVEINND